MKEEALRAAKEADVVVLAIGEHFLQSGEATSKGIIEIPKIQQELFEALSEVNSEIAVVLFNGRPLDIRILEERAKAILEVWMPGTMGGAAIVEVLRGAVSPAGKLPMSFPYCVSQVPVHYDEFPTGPLSTRNLPRLSTPQNLNFFLNLFRREFLLPARDPHTGAVLSPRTAPVVLFLGLFILFSSLFTTVK